MSGFKNCKNIHKIQMHQTTRKRIVNILPQPHNNICMSFCNQITRNFNSVYCCIHLGAANFLHVTRVLAGHGQAETEVNVSSNKNNNNSKGKQQITKIKFWDHKN